MLKVRQILKKNPILKSNNFFKPTLMRKFSTENNEKEKIEKEITKVETENLNKERLKLAAIGFAGGCIGTVAGIGGGVIMVPLMAAFTSLTRHQMTAT
jgi:uncharacterized membrane protein YfcA